MRGTSIHGAVLVLLVSLLLASGCAEDTAGPSGNSAPTILSLTANPSDVGPGDAVTLVASARDVDEDSLRYLWSASAGSFVGLLTDSTAAWTAPAAIGSASVYLAVSDDEFTVRDTLTFLVSIDLTATITSPADSVIVSPGTSIDFSGTVTGYSGLDYNTFTIRWVSDVDSVISSKAVDATGVTSFSTSSLTDTLHTIILTATIDDSLVASDTVVVNNSEPSTPTLYDIERGYTFNRVSWSAFSPASRFGSYTVQRDDGSGTYENVATITDATSNAWEDTTINIGQYYTYQVSVANSMGATAVSDTAGIRAGVYTLVENSRVGEIIFASAQEYLFATIPDQDELWVIDVTGNNVDHEISVGDVPWGVCANTWDAKIYVANSNDNSVSVLSSASPSNSAAQYTITLPTDPFYLDYFERDSVLYVSAADNEYPLIITENPDGTQLVDTLEDSRLRLIQGGSRVRVDAINARLLLSEVGNFAAGMWLYSISVDGSTPQYGTTAPQGSLGYGLQDFAFRPPAASQILVAATSPYSITVVTASTLTAADTLSTGPYPNAVAVSPDGATAYVALSSNDVQLWDIDSGTLQQSISFADPVLRGAIAINPGGNFLAVATYNATSKDSRIALFYLGN